MAVKEKINLEAFKEYVNTYQEKDSCGSQDTFIKDMIYGIGLAVDNKEYLHGEGYRKFIKYLKELLNG